MAKERYYKIKESSSDTSSNTSKSNSDNSEKKQRGRPKGTVGIKKTPKYEKLDDKTKNEIKKINKIVNMLSDYGSDTTEYTNKITELKKKKLIVNDDLTKNKKENEKVPRTKPIDEINFVCYLDTKTKRKFSKHI